MTLTPWTAQREAQIKTRKETESTRRTHFLESPREGQIGIRKETEQARGTHFLKISERGTSQHTKEIERASNTHFLDGLKGGTEGQIGTSGHAEKVSERELLASWRAPREG
jgi:hypothetical protein